MKMLSGIRISEAQLSGIGVLLPAVVRAFRLNPLITFLQGHLSCSCRQATDAQQVVGGAGQIQKLRIAMHALQAGLAQSADGLAPSKELLDPLAHDLPRTIGARLEYASTQTGVFLPSPFLSRASSEKTVDAPTRKRNIGNTTSVSVHPFHGAWSSCENVCPQSPGSFTRIINAMVMPRSMSTDSIRTGRVTSKAGAGFNVAVEVEDMALSSSTQSVLRHNLRSSKLNRFEF